ncbi:PolyADP-ribose polymerase [Vigna unguiculata]|uniref:PolyADP-ribose polymerase n=1 Tax=Vigna unguiculata TaxID=3917 RepID=A0A4D6KPW3_VIGUN|nr:PolyADP-ribose polymerase [Vigna unguiculata]
MFEAWLSLKKTLQCKPHPNHVHDPKTIRQQKGNQRTKLGNLENSNTKDFIQGSKRHSKNPLSFKGDIEITGPIIDEITLDSSNHETSRRFPCPQSNSSNKASRRTRRSETSSRIAYPLDHNEANVPSNTRTLVQMDSDVFSSLTCDKCGEKLKNPVAVEAHNVSNHSVIELEEDSSRQIIETICGTNSVYSESMLGEIDCILKVVNIPKTFACFEEYREKVKEKAEKQKKKHPRCVADGNELLRFHGTTIACSLGINSCYRLCTLDYCGICQILRHGFSSNKEFKGALGVYTTSTSGKAFESISIMTSHERPFSRKSIIVCRVIAGRICSPLEGIEERADSEFDSLAEKINGHSDVEELYVLNPRALLPCFVVIYKQQTAKFRRVGPSLRIGSF